MTDTILECLAATVGKQSTKAWQCKQELMEPTATLTWPGIITLALSTGLATAIFNHGFGWFRDFRKETATRHREASYAAVRIAVVLEEYSIRCADVASDVDFYYQTGETAGTAHTKLPTIPDYPTDIDWKSLNTSLSARSLSLRNEIPMSVGTIEALIHIGEQDSMPSECADQAGKCGYRAWILAADLRQHYALPIFDPKSVAWDVVGILKTHHDRAIKHAIQGSAA